MRGGLEKESRGSTLRRLIPGRAETSAGLENRREALLPEFKSTFGSGDAVQGLGHSQK